MAETITWDALRALAGFSPAKGRAISLYLNLDPSISPTQPDVATRINAALDEVRRQSEELKDSLSHEQREALKADHARMERWFEEEFDRDGALGAAVFADGADGLWSAHNLPGPAIDRVRVNDLLYLAPLVPHVGSGDGLLVGYVGRERADVYRLNGGRLVEIADETEDVPGRHDQGGWSQARYERHIETIVGRHLRRVADTLDRCVRRLRGVKIVLIGPEEVRAELDDLLTKEVSDALLGWATTEAHAGPPELLAAAEP